SAVRSGAEILVGSARTTLPPLERTWWTPYGETIVNRAEPSETSRCVRMPASRSRTSRSTPIAAPRPAATTRRRSASQPPSAGTLLARSIDGLPLQCRQLVDPVGRALEEIVEALPVDGHALRRRLHLHEAAVARHHDVEVDLRARVLDVVEVEQRLCVDDADGHGGDGALQRLREPEPVERATGRNVRAADRRAAGAAVRLENVAVEVHRPLAERLEVDDRAHRAADPALDLDGAAALLPARRLALGPLAGRRR